MHDKEVEGIQLYNYKQTTIAKQGKVEENDVSRQTERASEKKGGMDGEGVGKGTGGIKII